MDEKEDVWIADVEADVMTSRVRPGGEAGPRHGTARGVTEVKGPLDNWGQAYE